MVTISLGSYLFDPDVGLTDSNGNTVAINQRGLAILETLLAAQGKAVSKSELMERVWPGQIVEEGNLAVQIAALRKTLGERPDGGEWIITVPRVGYRMGVAQQSFISAATARVAASLPEQPTLAVLPFQNLSGDPGQDYFADGIVEDIIIALSRFKSFAVIARNSSFTYKGRAVDVRQVAKELGVRYIVEGSVRKAGDMLRITAQLVDGTNSCHLWAQNFDGSLSSVFDFQDLITESVATVVEPQIHAAEIARSRMERPVSVASYDLFLQAYPKIINHSDRDNSKAFTLLSRALALEPDNARYLAHSAWALSIRHLMGWMPVGPDDIQKCSELTRRALRGAAGDAGVMSMCGTVLLHIIKDYPLAMAVTQSATEANPHSLEVVTDAGVAHLHCGDVKDALAFFHRSIRLNPRDPFACVALTGIAHAHMIYGDYVEALHWANRASAVGVDFGPARWMLIAANAKLGRMDEARHHLAAFRRSWPDVTVSRIWAGQPQKYTDRMANILEGLHLAGLE